MKRLVVFTLGLAAALTIAALAVVLVPAGLREQAVPPATPPTPATPIAPPGGQGARQAKFRKFHEAVLRAKQIRDEQRRAEPKR